MNIFNALMIPIGTKNHCQIDTFYFLKDSAQSIHLVRTTLHAQIFLKKATYAIVLLTTPV